MRAIWIFLLLFCLTPSFGRIERVIIISVDSMNSDYLFNPQLNPNFTYTPNMGQLVRNGASFPNARGVLPSLTQVNHLSMISGYLPNKFGFPGNHIFFKENGTYLRPWRHPELIKSDTLFKAMEKEDPNYTTAVVAGKDFVGCTIWADIQVGPSCVNEGARRLGISEFPEFGIHDAPDSWVADNALKILKEVDPDAMLIHFGFLDQIQHYHGFSSTEALSQLSWADQQIGRLLEYLVESSKLNTTLIVLIADHGQTNRWKDAPLRRVLEERGIKATFYTDGSMAHIYLRDRGQLEEAVEALEESGMFDGIWVGDELKEIGLNTPYSGDIFVSLRPPYRAPVYVGPLVFSYGKPGTHGGLAETFIPLVFFGPHVKEGVFHLNASLLDVVPTISNLTGYPAPLDLDGKVLSIYDESEEVPSVKPYLAEWRRRKTSLPLGLSSLSVLILGLAFRPRKRKVSLSSLGLGLLICSLLLSQVAKLYLDSPTMPQNRFLFWNFTFPFLLFFLFPFLLSFSLLGLKGRGGLVRRLIRLGAKHLGMRGDLSPSQVLFPISVSTMIYIWLLLLLPIPYQLVSPTFSIFWYGGFFLSFLTVSNAARRKGLSLLKSVVFSSIVVFPPAFFMNELVSALLFNHSLLFLPLLEMKFNL